MNIKAFTYIKKRYQMLLEVLIAFALIVMCVLPLISTHVSMLKMQNQFIRKIELDHVVNLLYAKVLEKLYLNSYSFGDLTVNQTVFDVDASFLSEIGYDKPLQFKGSFNFFETKPKYKPKKAAPYTLYLFKLTFHFLPVEFVNAPAEKKAAQMITYTYDVFLVRDLQAPGGS